jgi:NADH:ubiquinone oxidoreductase subunit H
MHISVIVIISEILNSTLHLLDLLSYYMLLDFKYSTNYTLVFTFKIVLCLSFLIFIRGGVPRYRYDFLTKIG